MKDEEYQQDLFGYPEPKKRILIFSNIFRKADFDGTLSISFTLDKIVFISIGMIMAMVLVFAIGVEKGRSLSRAAEASPAAKQNVPEKSVSISSAVTVSQRPDVQKNQKPGQKPAVTAAAVLSQPMAAASNKTAPASAAQQKVSQLTKTVQNAALQQKAAFNAKTAQAVLTSSTTPDKSKPYTIVAATYSKKEYASQEAARLKKDGFDAYVYSNEPYFVVCIGSFADKDGAQPKKALARIRQIYKDAYFKLK